MRVDSPGLFVDVFIMSAPMFVLFCFTLFHRLLPLRPPQSLALSVAGERDAYTKCVITRRHTRRRVGLVFGITRSRVIMAKRLSFVDKGKFAHPS